ncbi:DUF2325 domain-containing protein [Comamonas guangdongensis]|uniref:DUF2325 domain-containing protein n=1 Tax=Comamonas guangdongensis TaxID=510515 RepID=A0ABV3ZZ85_9BURK
MLEPPFKRHLEGMGASAVPVNVGPVRLAPCCAHEASEDEAYLPRMRLKLHELDTPLHCSIVGNCLSPGELRRLMAKHVNVKGQSDLEVHHTAVRMAGQKGDVSKALHKALDQRHAGAIRAFASAKDEAELHGCWKQAWAQGDIPSAYWAVLTHKALTAELCQKVFGEVHMLAHLMGAANRHELKRFVAMEKENTELHERLDREQLRRRDAIRERDQMVQQLQQQALEFERRSAQYRSERSERSEPSEATQMVALQTQRRECAEQAAQQAREQLVLMEEQLERLREHGRLLSEELAAAEAELHQLSALADGSAGAPPRSGDLLRASRVLYVGGRPSSTPAIRDYVCRQGGEFLHHDGGLEDRKGLLDGLLPRASLVVFPVDCVDHHSVGKLKRLSERHQIPFVPLRSASLACFAATLKRELLEKATGSTAAPRLCLRHS